VQSVSLCKNVFTQCKQIYTKRKRNIKNKHLALWLTDIVHLIVRGETTRCRDKRIEYLFRIIMLICLFIIGFPKSKYDKSTWGFTCGILKHFFRSIPIQWNNRSREREKERECVTKVHTQSTCPYCPISIHNILLLEIQLSGGGCDPIIRLTPVTYLCLSRPKNWISNAICRGLFWRERLLFVMLILEEMLVSTV